MRVVGGLKRHGPGFLIIYYSFPSFIPHQYLSLPRAQWRALL